MPTSTQMCRTTPFVRYQPHRCSLGVVAADTEEGIHEVANTSPLFAFCDAMCATGGGLNQGDTGLPDTDCPPCMLSRTLTDAT
jgi:hypothetical protein